MDPNTNLVVTITDPEVMLASTMSSAAGNWTPSTIRKPPIFELKVSTSPANVKSTVTVVRYMEPGKAGGGEGGGEGGGGEGGGEGDA